MRDNVPMREYLSPSNLSIRGVPRLFHNATLDEYDLDEEIKSIFVKYIDNLEQMLEDVVNIVCYGTNGSGKSYLTSIVVKEAYRQRFGSFRVTLQNLLDLQFKKEEDSIKELLDEYYDCDFLVIDEIGKETFAKNSWNIIILEEILRHRDTLGCPTILCMNLPLEGKGGFYEQYGKSIKSLVEGTFVKVEFTGKDFRYDVAKEKKGIQILFE